MPALFSRLVEASEAAWSAYTRHQFVLLLAAGDLPEACFRRYLVQDYLFLIHFCRAYGLAIKHGVRVGFGSDVLFDARLAGRQGAHLAKLARWYSPVDVLRMAFFQDKSHAAIAREMKLPLGTVKSRIRLALSRLREALGGERP